MIGAALALAGGTLAAGILIALLAGRLPTLRLRVVALALGAVLLPLGAVLASGLLMFDSGHDLTVLAVASASGAAALVGALSSADPTATGGAPVRVVLGEHDALVEHETVSVAWLGATLEHVAGAGHLVPLEAPAALAAALTG